MGESARSGMFYLLTNTLSALVKQKPFCGWTKHKSFQRETYRTEKQTGISAGCKIFLVVCLDSVSINIMLEENSVWKLTHCNIILPQKTLLPAMLRASDIACCARDSPGKHWLIMDIATLMKYSHGPKHRFVKKICWVAWGFAVKSDINKTRSRRLGLRL